MKKNAAVSVVNLIKTFNIPVEANSGLKQKIINHLKGVKGFRSFTPLNNISFEVEQGDFFGIVGRNGSGKSTLLKTIAGIYTPNSGLVNVSGTLVPFIELGVGFNPELTGKENVFLNGALLGFSRKEIEVMYAGIVEFAELQDFMGERLKNYSSGMQVRLAFSIAIQAKGDILLLDEVLAVGDAAFQQKCFDYFEKLKRDKKTIIIVTHDMNAVKRFCNRAMILKDGHIEKIGTPDEVADLYTEENIEEKENEEQKNHLNIVAKLSSTKQRFKKDDDVKLRVSYNQIEGERCYINISFVYNGFVIADKNTKFEDSLNDQTQAPDVVFTQSLRGFNSGKYDIYFSLHRLIDNKLIEHIPRVATFFIEGRDPSLDGPMRLNGTWAINGRNKE